jgi:hypothetical protein
MNNKRKIIIKKKKVSEDISLLQSLAEWLVSWLLFGDFGV